MMESDQYIWGVFQVFEVLPERPEELHFIIKIRVFSAKIPVGFFQIARTQEIL